MRRLLFSLLATASLAGFGSATACAQGANPLSVGAAAPDVELTAATRYGVLAEPIRLSDFRGKTVVLAFFYRARTPG